MRKPAILLAALAAFLSHSAMAQITVHPPKVIPPVFLVQMKAVGEELQLTDDQKAKIATLPQQPGPLKEGEDPMERMSKLPKNDEEWEAAYAKLKSFLDPAQIERLGQLHRQYNGVYGLSYPEYKKQFDVTNKQLDDIADVYASVLEDILNSRALPSRDSNGVRITVTREDTEKAKAKTLEAAKKILTPDQMKKWEDSLGKPFDFFKKAN